MKTKLIVLALILFASCSKDSIEPTERGGCCSIVDAYEHDTTATNLLFSGELDAFFQTGLEREKQYALIITHCDGTTTKLTILNK